MHRSNALTAIAALGLTVIAGLSAAAVTLDHGTPSATPAAVQYVDQYGNPVAPPTAATPAASASASVASAAPAAPTGDRTPAPVVRETGEHEDGGD